MRIASVARALALLAFPAAIATAQQLNTGSGGPILTDPFGAFFAFTTVGETFVSPAGFSHLDQITFEFQGIPGGNSSGLLFRAFVMAWDGKEVTGPILYESDPATGTDGGPTTYVFNTGGIPVTPGVTYVAFANASEFVADNFFVDAQMTPFSGVSTIPGGSYVWTQNFDDFDKLRSEWDIFSSSPPNATDLAFTATFGTPEPATFGLFGTGLLAVAGIARRRKTRTQM